MTYEEYRQTVLNLRDSDNQPLAFNSRNSRNQALTEVSIQGGTKLISMNTQNNLHLILDLNSPKLSEAMREILFKATMDYLATPYADRKIDSRIHQVDFSSNLELI